MCLHPISIKNPNFHKNQYASEHGSIVEVPKYMSSSQEYITVPCNKCADCRQSYHNSILQRALVESLTSYMFFITLTYDNKHLPIIRTSQLGDVYYADYEHIKDLFKRVRNINLFGNRDFRYLCVIEYGDTYSRPHFHLILFVSRLDGDSSTQPYHLEKLIFDNFRQLYAVNLGTRKQPIYESLFTYRRRVTSKGVKTNYYVKYVCPGELPEYALSDSSISTPHVKTIRYLLGYVNKGSSFDDTIISKLSTIYDVKLRTKLKHLLSSKVHFSKGFGFGFDTSSGQKLYLPKISVKSSLATLQYSINRDLLPPTFDDYAASHPSIADEVSNLFANNIYKFYTSLEEFISHCDATRFLAHLVLIHYFPKEFSDIYDSCYRIHQLDAISYYFNNSPYVYNKPVVTTTYSDFNYTFRYLRQGIEEGFLAGVPYIAFKNIADGSFTSLCPFYRERLCTIQDIATLYLVCGVTNWDEWSTLFQNNIDTKKAERQQYNRFSHQKEEIICKVQKKYLDLSPSIDGEHIYTHLVSDY